MISSIAFFAAALQSATPAVDAASFYGMKTYTTNAEFGFLPDRFVVGFAPEDISEMSMHVLKADGSEVIGGGVYETLTDYPAFKLMRFIPMPVINLAHPGKYSVEFRHKGSAVSNFPFEIQRKATGDEFNPTFVWEFITPVDKMGTINFSNTKADAGVFVSAWFAPGREGINAKSPVQVALFHNGKKVAQAADDFFQEPQNTRRTFRMNGIEKFKPFHRSDLVKLDGALEARVMIGGKAIRTFKWSMSGGKIKPIARSESNFEPRTGYYMPRRLAGVVESYQGFHLEEQYWAVSQ